MSQIPALRSDALANRRKLIEAAHAVFAERGLNAEMKEIAERAGVGVGTIYRNFATKEELLAAIIGALMEQAESMVRRAEVEPDPARAIVLLVDGAWEVAERNAGLVHALRAGGAGTPPLHDLKAEAMQAGGLKHGEWVDAHAASELDSRTNRIFERAINAGVIRKGLTPQFLSAYFHAMFMIFVELRSSLSADEARTGGRDVFFHGVLAAE
jgi:AcrR family transcriptional regulator